MAVEFTDVADEIDEIEAKEGGRGLRRKLEETLSNQQKLLAELSSLKVEKAITEKGWSEVKPADLAGVSLSDIDKKGEALQKERVDQKVEIAKTILAAQGYEGEALEQAALSFAAGQPVDTATSDMDDVRTTGGTLPPKVDVNQLSPFQKIEYALAQKTKNK